MSNTLRVTLALLALLIAACGGAPAPTPTDDATGSPGDPGGSPSGAGPSPSAGGIEGLLGVLRSVSGEASEGEPFLGEPLASEAVTVCLGDEPISVYIFESPEAAMAQARRIDPRDPSKIGTTIIEWAGDPKFWLHENVLVLYLGTDNTTEQWLLDALGQPFAFGRGRPPLAGPDVC